MDCYNSFSSIIAYLSHKMCGRYRREEVHSAPVLTVYIQQNAYTFWTGLLQVSHSKASLGQIALVISKNKYTTENVSLI